MSASVIRPVLLLVVAVFLGSCTGPKTVSEEEFRTREVILPGGKRIRAEVMVHRTDMMRGMMFRDSLAPDRGMLFIHGQPGNYQYWMYQVRMPLDIVWMDSTRRIVEISANTPPCPEKSSSRCPLYGGASLAQYVLELGGGMAEKYGLKLGDAISF